MRTSVHDVPVAFRANARLLAAAQNKAQREGMSLSELLRHAVREAVKEDA